MSLLGILDVSGSGMSAQTVRMNTIASNLANAQSVTSNREDTYRARHPVFATTLDQANGKPSYSDEMDHASAGVRVTGVIESQAPLDLRYEPDHPEADDDGYVAYPNVSVVEEMANMISASRSFQVNVEVMQSAKQMAERLLQLGQ